MIINRTTKYLNIFIYFNNKIVYIFIIIIIIIWTS